ncbi:MAG TPA: hypothetical protein VGO63_01070 [Candidatus Paceibacterota bacterium]|jgi:hypothetical protein|nr:hypothetical protein [Candidatus Paceibacterota bacterium]
METPEPLTPKINPNKVEANNQYPSEEVFKAYIEGNSRIPQIFAGITIFTLAAVLEESNVEWEKFFNSKFSDAQIEHLKTLMNRMHHKKSISAATSDHKKYVDGKNFDKKIKVISEIDIGTLWENVVHNNIAYALSQCLQSLDPDYAQTFKNKGAFRKIDEADFISYLSDIKNKPVLNEAKKIFTAIRDALRSEAADELFKNWREEFDFSKPENKGNSTKTWYQKGYRTKISEVIVSYLRSQRPDISTDLVESIWG